MHRGTSRDARQEREAMRPWGRAREPTGGPTAVLRRAEELRAEGDIAMVTVCWTD